jgi:hypothetical protein
MIQGTNLSSIELHCSQLYGTSKEKKKSAILLPLNNITYNEFISDIINNNVFYNNAYKFHHHRSQTSNSQSSISGNNNDIYKCDVLYGEYTFEYNNSSYVMTLLNK